MNTPGRNQVQRCLISDVVDPTASRFAASELPTDAWVLELEDIERDTGTLLRRVRVADRTPKSHKLQFRQGDVLYSKLRPALNKVLLADADGFCTPEIIPLRIKQDVDPSYLHYWLRQPSFQHYAESNARGLHMPRVPLDAVLAGPFALQPFDIQLATAAYLDEVMSRLSTAVRGIKSAGDVATTLRDQVLASATQGALTSALRRGMTGAVTSFESESRHVQLPADFRRLTKRLPTFRSTPIDEFDSPDIPPGWAVMSVRELYDRNVLLDIADGNHGSAYPRSSDFTDVGVPFVTAKDLDSSQSLNLSRVSQLKEQSAARLSKGWARANDVLLTHNATIGRVSHVPHTVKGHFLLGTSVTFYRFNPEFVDPGYVALAFQAPFFQRQLRAVMQQTTRNQVPLSRQWNLRIVCPPVAEQRVIAARANYAITRVTSLQASCARALKALSGFRPRLTESAFGDLVSWPMRPSLAEEHVSQTAATGLANELRSIGEQDIALSRPARPPFGHKPGRSDHDSPPSEPLLAALLRANGELTATDLYHTSRLSIDDFYHNLWLEIQSGAVTHTRSGGVTRVRLAP